MRASRRAVCRPVSAPRSGSSPLAKGSRALAAMSRITRLHRLSARPTKRRLIAGGLRPRPIEAAAPVARSGLRPKPVSPSLQINYDNSALRNPTSENLHRSWSFRERRKGSPDLGRVAPIGVAQSPSSACSPQGSGLPAGRRGFARAPLERTDRPAATAGSPQSRPPGWRRPSASPGACWSGCSNRSLICRAEGPARGHGRSAWPLLLDLRARLEGGGRLAGPRSRPCSTTAAAAASIMPAAPRRAG